MLLALEISESLLNIVLYVLLASIAIFLVIGLAITNYAGENLVNIYNEHTKYIVPYFKTTEFAQNISENEFNGQMETKIVPGFLNDFYYNKTINLSSTTANSANVSAFSVCAHELGHAIQYRDTPEKMKKFAVRQMMSRFLAKLTIPFLLIGIVCIFLNIVIAIVCLGVSFLTFVVGLIAKLMTIRIEKEASQNAIYLLQKYAEFDDEQVKYAKKVLSAAKLTYVASFLKSVLKWTMLVRRYDFY